MPRANRRLPTFLGALIIAGAALFVSPRATAADPLYTLLAQDRSLEVDARYRILDPPDEVAAEFESLTDLGSFDRALDVDIFANPRPGTRASATAAASQTVIFAPDAIFGSLASTIRAEGQNASAGGSASSDFRTEFRIRPGPDVPYAFSGDSGGVGSVFLTIVDEDTEDPHGGGTVIFGIGHSGGSPGFPLEKSGVLLGGHR